MTQEKKTMPRPHFMTDRMIRFCITIAVSSCICSTGTAFFLTLPAESRKPCLFAASPSFENEPELNANGPQKFNQPKFDLDLALFCAGLAFDSYVEPPANSSRWERGSKGMNVAFVSSAFTKNLYEGMVEITPLKCTGLPDEDNNMEAALSGGGVDACIMVAAVEGQWKEDIELLKQGFHEGIMDLSGAAHVGRSSTAWSNVNINKSKSEKRKTGKAPAYHIPKTWGKDGEAVWPEEEPFYIYVQDPEKVKLLFTLFDDDVIGGGSPLGSTYISLAEVLPQVKASQTDLMIDQLKHQVQERIQRGEIEPDKIDEEFSKAINKDIKAWEGDLKLTSKPRIKNKNNQRIMGAAAGAMVAGPMGAAVGAGLASLYEGQVKGRIFAKLRYLPIPQASLPRNRYTVLGGMPGINWGDLYEKYVDSVYNSNDDNDSTVEASTVAGTDLEFCFFINHDQTGGCCAVYRSLEKKVIVISFRGTCQPVDLITDASIVQEPWVEGEDPKNEGIGKVHVGFRKSMNSISRRLKELVLATVGMGDSISDYDVIVTGHSLGGALATLFVADIGEFGIDAGRALPQTEQSEAWWKAIANTLTGTAAIQTLSQAPPRPKSLSLYNFGSPRVGNKAFAKRFGGLVQEGKINQAYRIVNDNDVVARAPRTMVTLSVDYDHCGSTVLVEEPTDGNSNKVIWIEGETDESACPVRDYETRIASPTSEGSLLGDLWALTKDNDDDNIGEELTFEQPRNLASKFGERLSKVTASDVATIIGIDKNFSERELKIVQSLVKGDALAHHMEDSYYAAMGRAVGFRAKVGEDIVKVD